MGNPAHLPWDVRLMPNGKSSNHVLVEWFRIPGNYQRLVNAAALRGRRGGHEGETKIGVIREVQALLHKEGFTMRSILAIRSKLEKWVIRYKEAHSAVVSHQNCSSRPSRKAIERIFPFYYHLCDIIENHDDDDGNSSSSSGSGMMDQSRSVAARPATPSSRAPARVDLAANHMVHNDYDDEDDSDGDNGLVSPASPSPSLVPAKAIGNFFSSSSSGGGSKRPPPVSVAEIRGQPHQRRRPNSDDNDVCLDSDTTRSIVLKLLHQNDELTRRSFEWQQHLSAQEDRMQQMSQQILNQQQQMLNYQERFYRVQEVHARTSLVKTMKDAGFTIQEITQSLQETSEHGRPEPQHQHQADATDVADS